MKIYFDFGLITVINTALILNHLPATVIQQLPKEVAFHYERIGQIYEKDLNVQVFDDSMGIKLKDKNSSDRTLVNEIIGLKKL